MAIFPKFRTDTGVTRLVLSRSWMLTRSHKSCRYGKPLLVNTETHQAHGPEEVLKAYPSWGYVPAEMVVERLAASLELSEAEARIIDDFTRRRRRPDCLTVVRREEKVH